MARTTVYNNITSAEKLAKVSVENMQLGEDWLEYMQSIDRSPQSIVAYRSDLNIFWVWNMEFNNNKFFSKLTKREIAKFQNHAINTWGWSPNRIRRVKSCLSSLSNYIENVLDDKTGSYPTSITDGTRYYKGAGNNSAASGTSSVTVSSFSSDATYYFRAFSYAVKDGAEWVSATTYTASAATTKGQQSFTSSGTFTIPAGVRSIDIFCVGGGGGYQYGSAGGSGFAGGSGICSIRWGY